MVTDFNPDIVPHLALHLLKAPPCFQTLWVVSTSCTLLVVLLAIKHLSSLVIIGTRLRRDRDTVFQPILVTIYKRIFCFFPLMGILSWSGLFAPKLSLMFLLVLRLYEFGCLMWFWELMIDLLDGPENAYRILAAKAPRNVLKVFPCCLTPWIYSKRRLRKRDISISWWLVAQYGPVNVVSILTVALSSHLQSLFTGLSAASLVVCMHGLFIMFASSHGESKEFRLTFKFMVIKLSVVLIKLVEILIRIPGVVPAYHFPYNEALMGMAWLCFAMNIGSLVFTIAAMLAFPAKEISARLEKHMEKIKARASINRGEFNSDQPPCFSDGSDAFRKAGGTNETGSDEEIAYLSPTRGLIQYPDSVDKDANSTMPPSLENITMEPSSATINPAALSDAIVEIPDARVMGRCTLEIEGPTDKS